MIAHFSPLCKRIEPSPLNWCVKQKISCIFQHCDRIDIEITENEPIAFRRGCASRNPPQLHTRIRRRTCVKRSECYFPCTNIVLYCFNCTLHTTAVAKPNARKKEKMNKERKEKNVLLQAICIVEIEALCIQRISYHMLWNLSVPLNVYEYEQWWLRRRRRRCRRDGGGDSDVVSLHARSRKKSKMVFRIYRQIRETLTL